MAIYHKLLNSIDMEKLKILNLNFSFQRAGRTIILMEGCC